MLSGFSVGLIEFPVGSAPSDIPLTVRVPSAPSGSGKEFVTVNAVPESAIEELCANQPEFELVGQLGEGAFGRVYLAKQHALGGRLVALKVSSEEVGEAQLLARLLHTNIVPVYSVHRLGYCYAVCMPYMGSTTLADLIRDFSQSGLPESGRHLVSTLQSHRYTSRKTDRGTGSSPIDDVRVRETSWPEEGLPVLPPSTEAILDLFSQLSYTESVVWMGQQLADGLAHAHERGIIHRDLKPANVLLTDEGQPMLLDFNLAQEIASADKARLGGTMPYMAPEVLRQVLGETGTPEPIGPRSDLYSLGLILFELLTGQRRCPPCSGTMHEFTRQLMAMRNAPCPSLRALNPAVSPALESIVRHCLEPNPEKRYQSAREVQEDLKRQRENQPLKYAPDPSLKERARKWMRRHPRLTALLGAIVVASALVAGLTAQAMNYRSWAIRLDAEQSLEQLGERALETQFCLASLAREDSDRADRQAREALAPYGVLDDDRWQDRPKVRNLSPEKRERLEATVASLLLIAARSEALRGEQVSGPEREQKVKAALALNAKAEQIGDNKHIPRALLGQKADLLKLAGEVQQAEAIRNEAQQQQPRGINDALLTGRELLAQGQFRQALPVLQDAVKFAEDDPSAWFLLARCQDFLGLDRDAIASYTIVLATRPRSGICYFQRGLAYFRLNDNPQALRDFEKSIELGHFVFDARINRSLTLHRLGRLDDAIEEITKGIDEAGPYARVYFIRSRFLEQKGDRAGAKRDRDEGLKREPSDELSWATRGFARLQDDPRGALADFERAIQINPRSLSGLLNAAHILGERLGQKEAASKHLDKAVEVHSQNASVRLARGLLRAQMGKRAEALDDAKEAVKLAGDASTLFQAGAIYAQTSQTETKDRDESIRLLKLALRKGYGHDQLLTSPLLAPLRKSKEFEQLVAATKGLK